MERTKYFAILMGLLFAAHVSASPALFQERIYQAFITGDMEAWSTVLFDFEKQDPVDIPAKIELVNYYYGYTGWLIGNDKPIEAKRNIERAEQLIDEILATVPNHATAWAYQGAFIGFRIGLNLFKAPFLGPKSVKCVERALEINASNIQATIEHANALYYRPAIFGGDKKLAIVHYKKAVTLFEKQARTTQNWNYLNLLTVLAQAYEDTDQKSRAKAVYEKILDIEPTYSWVRDELYPALLETM